MFKTFLMTSHREVVVAIALAVYQADVSSEEDCIDFIEIQHKDDRASSPISLDSSNTDRGSVISGGAPFDRVALGGAPTR